MCHFELFPQFFGTGLARNLIRAGLRFLTAFEMIVILNSAAFSASSAVEYHSSAWIRGSCFLRWLEIQYRLRGFVIRNEHVDKPAAQCPANRFCFMHARRHTDYARNIAQGV